MFKTKSSSEMFHIAPFSEVQQGDGVEILSLGLPMYYQNATKGLFVEM